MRKFVGPRMATQEQFQQLVIIMQEMARAITVQAQTMSANVPVGDVGHRQNIQEGKRTNRLQKFGKGEDSWKDYNFELGVILGSESPDMLETLKFMETSADEMDTATIRAMDESRADRMNIEKVSKELYEVLVVTTEGEARLTVRNIATHDGIQAWHRLYLHYTRRTFARVLRMHWEAMHPKPVKDMEALISHIVEWEDRWNRMAKEHKDPLPVIWKMAALMELCPPEVQDMIYQNVDEVNEDYDKLKQKIVTWTSNKVANEGVPMDIGRVGWHDDHDHDHDDFEISAIGQQTQCYNCGGWEHLSRECPSEKKCKGKGKDFGKGGKDFGKGGKDYGKGGKDYGEESKDSGKGGKDRGKVYQGACFNCGKVGHWMKRTMETMKVRYRREPSRSAPFGTSAEWRSTRCRRWRLRMTQRRRRSRSRWIQVLERAAGPRSCSRTSP